jgi:nucleoside-diphosphate-sugar epimerase
VYDLANFVLTKKYIPLIGHGQARWNNLHINDLTDAIFLLVEAAVAGNANTELWGAGGYFTVESGEHVWGDLAKQIGANAYRLGLLESEPQARTLNAEEGIKEAGFAAMGWAWNARAKSERLNKVLGWSASRPSLEEDMSNIIKFESAIMTRSA